jgi:hypothetical protein
MGTRLLREVANAKQPFVAVLKIRFGSSQHGAVSQFSLVSILLLISMSEEINP